MSMALSRYGYAHQQMRAQWILAVNRGTVDCHARVCLELSRRIEPGSAWDLGHDSTATVWTGPEHSRCNRTEGATRGNRIRAGATGSQEY